MKPANDLTSLVVLEPQSCLQAAFASDDVLTLIALASEDPASWEEAKSVWPRYRTSEDCELVSPVAFELTQRETTITGLQSAESWVVIDFESKRIFTGGEFQQVGRDSVFRIIAENEDLQGWPLCLHLPPWWELHEGVLPEVVNMPRQTPIKKPSVDRDVLYGDIFLGDLATRILQTVASPDWRNRRTGNDASTQYYFTVAIHRDWLMTPREDLGGRRPRDLLHGARAWNDRVVDGQRRRFEEGSPMVAAPIDWDGFANAPMGSQEMCMYFDLCREVILAGWKWFKSKPGQLALKKRDSALLELVQYLRTARDTWLASPFEGGSAPSFIIECDRRRVPRGAGVAIEGMDSMEPAQHIADCDCPICQMMADGMLGVAFDLIDGHHLELDDEFAFSMCETHREWQEQRFEFEELDAVLDGERFREAGIKANDPLASAWVGVSEKAIIADRTDLLIMAFMVSEIVSDLQRLGAAQTEIRSLNEAFADYRSADDAQRARAAFKFKEALQSLDGQYADLVSKSADLQSHIDALERSSPFDGQELGSGF